MASKIPETGAGSRKRSSYGIAKIKETPFGQDVSSFFKKLGANLAERNNRLVSERESGNTVAKTFQKVGDYFTGTGEKTLSGEKSRLDSALQSNTFKPSGAPNLQQPSLAPGMPRQAGFVPNPDAQFERLGAGPRPGAEFGSGMTITQNRFGDVGIFDSLGKRAAPGQRFSGGDLGGTPLPAGQSPFFMKMNTSPENMSGTINYTDTFAQDAQRFGMQMENAKNDYRIGDGNPRFFTGPGEPGPGNYGQDSMMSQFRSRRDQLQSSLMDYERKNPLGPNATVGDIISQRAGSKTIRDEIRQIDEQIFGRTELANKIMTALIGKDTAMGVQGMENDAKLTGIDKEGQWNLAIRGLMEGEETKRNNDNIVAGRFDPKTQARDKGFETSLDFEKQAKLEYLKSLLTTGGVQDQASFNSVLRELSGGFGGNTNNITAFMDALEKEEK